MGRPTNPDSIYKVRVEELEEPDELLTMAEAKRKYGLSSFHIYAARRRREVSAVRRGAGQTYYLESQLKLLARSIGLYSECSAA